MRKKRKLRTKAEENAARKAELELPEVREALEAEALVAAAEAVDRAAAAAAAEAERKGETVGGELVLAEAEGEKLTQSRITSIVESYLLASDRILTIADIHKLMGVRTVPRPAIQVALDQLVEAFADRGIVLHHIAGAYQLRTHPANAKWVQRLVAGRPVRLSRAQLETLAICAYRQPITRPEIDEIRGVDSGNTLRILLDRSLIRILGKKEEPGRPLLYGTTKEFLEFFNLGDLAELPTLREYSELSEDSIAEVEKLGHDINQSVVDAARSDDDDEGGSSSSGGGGSDGGAGGTPSEGEAQAEAPGQPEGMAADGSDASDLAAAASEVGLAGAEAVAGDEAAVPDEVLATGSGAFQAAELEVVAPMEAEPTPKTDTGPPPEAEGEELADGYEPIV